MTHTMLRIKPRPIRLFVRVVAIAIVAGCALPAAALAGYPFDSGVSPAVAYGPGGELVEVHQGANGAGPLWFSTATENLFASNPAQSADWTNSAQYDLGESPSVASGKGPPYAGGSEFIDQTPVVVEVHQGGAGAGPLWYRTAVWNGSSLTWYNSHEYDSYGMSPSVAVNTSGTVVEVQQGGAGAGPLWYRVGTLSDKGSTVTWGPSAQYDTGASPSVAIYGETVTEVHQGDSGVGELWYRVGTVSPSTSTITWGSSHPYAYGMSPSVSVDTYGNQIKEVHQAGAGFGPLLTVSGTPHAGNTIAWGASSQYDTGVSPHVTEFDICADDYTEVHQGAVGFSTLWYDASVIGCQGPQ